MGSGSREESSAAAFIQGANINAASSLIQRGSEGRWVRGSGARAEIEVMGRNPSLRDLKGRGDMMGTFVVFSEPEEKECVGGVEWRPEVRSRRASSQRT